MVYLFFQEEQEVIFSVSVFERVSVLFSGTQKNSSDNSSGCLFCLSLSKSQKIWLCYKDNKSYKHLKLINACRIQETSVKLVSH